MTAETTPVHSAWLTAQNITANTNCYTSVKEVIIIIIIYETRTKVHEKKMFYLAAYCLLAMSRKNY